MKIEEYEKMEGVKFPFKSESGFTIEGVDGFCSDCGKKLDGLKCKIIDHDNCVQIFPFGICWSCNMFVSCSPMRRYKDGRFIWSVNGKWVEEKKNKKWWHIILDILMFKW